MRIVKSRRLVDNRDLLERTQRFSETILEVAVELPKNSINNVLVGQTIRAVTSVGANYREGCEAESSKDFVHKIRISKKEARESHYWLTLLFRANPGFASKIKPLIDDSMELVKIFSTIVKKFQNH
ncbi:four helix bundle protein [Candidatus Microgenomates bacterium]|nr:four helix bundle protein [Candidatus Microgenomates bacterium]